MAKKERGGGKINSIGCFTINSSCMVFMNQSTAGDEIPMFFDGSR